MRGQQRKQRDTAGADDQLRGSLALRLEKHATHVLEHHGQTEHGHPKAGEDGERIMTENDTNTANNVGKKPHVH